MAWYWDMGDWPERIWNGTARGIQTTGTFPAIYKGTKQTIGGKKPKGKGKC